jgi:hypothetical protein
MFRRSLFLGLMVLLGAVLVSLVVQGRRQEKKEVATRVVEVVKQFKPTPTVVIAPLDLQIIGSDNIVRFAIRNQGTMTYNNPEVEIVYLTGDGRVLKSEIVKIDKVIPPGQEIPVENAVSGKAPERTRRTLLKLHSAELCTDCKKSEPHP